MAHMPVAIEFEHTRQFTESLCSPLSIEDYQPQLVDYASPPKWHLAHTTWFFEEMILKKFAVGYSEYDPEFGFLFNSYYNQVGERIARSARGDITRPNVEEVYLYRKHVDKHMHDVLENAPPKEVIQLAILGINHEQQHQELLLTDLKFTLGHNPLFPAYDKSVNLVNDLNNEQGLLKIDEGLYDIGYDGAGFHFDNECERHKVYLNAFSLEKNLVTNGDYIEFIEDNGYEKFEHWLDDGWHWMQQNNIQSPLYWQKVDGQWHHYTFSGLIPVATDAILAHVSYYEAFAFASWKGKRLPTEFEWEVASDQLPWGKRWEWTNSAYLPYPGFKISKDAVGEYNGKFMINQMVLRGASAATAIGHSRKSYRNFFHPHLQWQFSGIRLAQ
jgi:ergothioneine biosynthesis protein EgtB